MDAGTYLIAGVAADDVAVIEGGSHHTYGALREMSGRIAAALSAMDLPNGSRVGLLGPNSLLWIAGYLATLRLGLVVVPFPTTFTRAELERGADWASVGAIISDRPVPAGVRAPRIIPDDLQDDGTFAWPDPDRVDPDSDALLMFTSGSTGRPRAVRITHRNIMANTESIISFLEIERRDRIMVVLPFTYSFGASLLHTHLRAGASMVLVNSLVFPETVVETLARESCTELAGVPSSFHMLLRNSSFTTRELPHLRLVQQAGGKLTPPLVEELIAASHPARVFVMYGATEATARMSYLKPGMALVKAGSVGMAIPGVELTIRDALGSPAAPGEVGELCARGPNISPGYFQDPEATAEKFVGGELRTGDLAMTDEEGFIYIVDRASDLIKTWGFRVSSQQVEAVAMSHPLLVAAACIGVPDPQAGERIALFAVKRADADLDPDAVVRHCRRQLAKHMVPAVVRFLPALPLNGNGKVSKAALREMLKDLSDETMMR